MVSVKCSRTVHENVSEPSLSRHPTGLASLLDDWGRDEWTGDGRYQTWAIPAAQACDLPETSRPQSQFLRS